ncbi:hypothetical protein NHF46_14485 [Arthrobacter alpinus]|nr:hypothetical protein [Arthrobacter alpinus]
MSRSTTGPPLHRSNRKHYVAHAILGLLVIGLIMFFALTTTKIANGASQLHDGTKLTAAGANKLQDGATDLDEGAAALSRVPPPPQKVPRMPAQGPINFPEEQRRSSKELQTSWPRTSQRQRRRLGIVHWSRKTATDVRNKLAPASMPWMTAPTS